MTYRRARSLDVLMAEIDKAAPGRSRASDGWIGDAAHATRDSDHNPWVRLLGVGIVTAQDITDDDGYGVNAADLAEAFRRMGKAGDPRIKYVISEGQIASSREDWRWRPYTGTNGHFKHVHLSVSPDPQHYDSTKPWGVMLKPVSVSRMKEAWAQDRKRRGLGLYPAQTRRVQRALGFKVLTGRWGRKTRNRFPETGPTRASLRAVLRGRYRVVP